MAAELGEPPEITAERETLKLSISTMKKSLKILQRDPEITATLSYDDELSRDIKMSLEQDKRAKMAKEQARNGGDPNRRGPPPGARQGPPPSGGGNLFPGGQGGRPGPNPGG